MAKKPAASAKKPGKGNLAQAIRDEFQKNGIDTRPRDIIATLAERGIKVSPAQVSNIKRTLLSPSKAKGKRGRRGKADSHAMHDHAHESHSHDEITLDMSDIIDAFRLAKKLLDKVGDLQLAHDVLDASAELQNRADPHDEIPF